MLDFICVASCLVSFAIDKVFPEANIGPVTSVVRIFRIGRLFRLLRFAKGLNKLFNAFLMSLPKLVNVGCILSLLLFSDVLLLSVGLARQPVQSDDEGTEANRQAREQEPGSRIKLIIGKNSKPNGDRH